MTNPEKWIGKKFGEWPFPNFKPTASSPKIKQERNEKGQFLKMKSNEDKKEPKMNNDNRKPWPFPADRQEKTPKDDKNKK